MVGTPSRGARTGYKKKAKPGKVTRFKAGAKRGVPIPGKKNEYK